MSSDSKRPHLVPIYSAGIGVQEGPAIRLDAGPTVLGRDEGTGILGFPTDTRVSRHHAELTVTEAFSRVCIRDLDSKNGTFVNGRKVSELHLVDGDLIRLGESFLLVRWHHRAEEPASDLSGRAPTMIELRTAVDKLDPFVRRVLLEGGEGAVFEDVARAIHRRINPEGAIVRVDASALTSGDLEASLAGTATIFIDALDALPDTERDALLAAEGLAPVVAKTTKDLDALVYAGAFDAPLVDCFEGHRIRVPRLAERREDLLGLFFAALGDDVPRPTTDLIETLLIYPWSAGVMELMEVAAELRVRGSGLDALVVELVSPRLRGSHRAGPFGDDALTAIEIRKPVPSKPDLEGLLAIHGGQVDAVADVMGWSRMEVVAWMRRYQIDEAAE